MTGKRDRPARPRVRKVGWRLGMLTVIIGAVATPVSTGDAASASTLPPSFVTYQLSGGNAPVFLRLGPDGRWWLPRQDVIDQVTMGGVDSALPLGSPCRVAGTGTTGGDGNFWVSDACAGQFDKFSPAGALLASYPYPNPADLALGSDGNLWFGDNSVIGQVTPTGTITQFPLPPSSGFAAGLGPGTLISGPDGNIWFDQFDNNQNGWDFGRITTQGAVLPSIPIPMLDGRAAQPSGLTVGPDGSVWYADGTTGAIGRVTSSGEVTQFILPGDLLAPVSIGTGPDGNLWFTGYSAAGAAHGRPDAVGRITTGGQVGVFGVTSGGFPGSIAGGPDGRVWLGVDQPCCSAPENLAAFQPFAPAPSAPEIRDISTRYSGPSGGGQVVVTGYDVGFATKVLFGSTPATSFSSLGPGQLVATVPPHAVGATDITVDTPYGTSVTTPPALPITSFGTPGTTGSHFYYQAANCGTAIAHSTQLAGDIGPCYTGGLTVAADNVTLDLNGHSVIGFQDPRQETNGAAVGINLQQRSGVTVENGSVSGFNAGIHIGGGSGNVIAHMNIHDNIGPPNAFTSQFGDGIMIESSSGNQIVHNVVNHNGIFDGIGIFDPGSDGNTIAYNTVENTQGTPDKGPVGEGIIINGATGASAPTAIHGSVIDHNVVSNNASSGIANINVIGGRVEYNTITGSGATNAFGNGIGVQVGFSWNLGPTKMVIEHNQVSGNGVDGIRLGGTRGFFRGAAEGNTLADNIVTGNAANLGADVSENWQFGFRGYDLHDDDPTCGTNVWSKNTWGSAGFTPACTSTGGSGPAAAGQQQTATVNSPASQAHSTATFPNAQAWEAFLERGRS